MALYKTLELSFIDNKLVAEGEVVDINDDPANGGFEPGLNFVKCDVNGNPDATTAARSRKKPVEPSTDLA